MVCPQTGAELADLAHGRDSCEVSVASLRDWLESLPPKPDFLRCLLVGASEMAVSEVAWESGSTQPSVAGLPLPRVPQSVGACGWVWW